MLYTYEGQRFFGEKFLSEISTWVKNFCWILVKMKKKYFFWIEILGRNFWPMTEISAQKIFFEYFYPTYIRYLNRL